jgi:hypothetical protein
MRSGVLQFGQSMSRQETAWLCVVIGKRKLVFWKGAVYFEASLSHSISWQSQPRLSESYDFALQIFKVIDFQSPVSEPYS